MKRIILLLGSLVVFSTMFIPSSLSNMIVDMPPDITIENPKEGYVHYFGINLFKALDGDTVNYGGAFYFRPIQVKIIDDIDGPEDITATITFSPLYQDEETMDMVYDAENQLFECDEDFKCSGWYDIMIPAEDSNVNTADETIHVYFTVTCIEVIIIVILYMLSFFQP